MVLSKICENETFLKLSLLQVARFSQKMGLKSSNCVKALRKIHISSSPIILTVSLICLHFSIRKEAVWVLHSVERCISPPFFTPPLLDISLSLEICTPPPSWHSSQENIRFYDDTLESGRLKTINTKPWKPITYRNCVSLNVSW